MIKNNKLGIASLPIIIGGVIVAGLLITAVWFAGDKPATTQTIVENLPPRPVPVKSKIIWGSINPGVYSRTGSSKASASEKVQIGGQGTTALKVESNNNKLVVSLKTPEGQVVSAASAVAQGVKMIKTTDPTTGKTAYLFQIASNNQNNPGQNQEWEVVINNQNTNSPSTYDLTVSDSSLVNANPADSNVSSNQTGDQSATLSLTVTETVSIGVTVPILNADITASVTDPNGNVTIVDLTQNPNTPGNYTGTFTDIDTPGTYEVTYNISGTNAAGEHFDQIVTDQFTVPDPNAVAPTGGGSSNVGSDKKYDINQSCDITPVQ